MCQNMLKKVNKKIDYSLFTIFFNNTKKKLQFPKIIMSDSKDPWSL